MLANFWWDLSKLNIRIFFLCRIVPVAYSYFFTSIDLFDWSKISSKFFGQALFGLLLTCVYCVYWISINWDWNLSSRLIVNCMWDINKSDIQLFFPLRFVEGRGEGYGCGIPLVCINLFNVFKSIIPSSSCWFLFKSFYQWKKQENPYKLIDKHHWWQFISWESLTVLVRKFQLL